MQSITFKSITETKDSGGSVEEAESTVLENYKCVIDNVSSTERVMAERNGHLVSHRIFGKYNSLINKDLIITWDSEDYKITYVRNPNNLDRTLELDIYLYG